MASCIRSYIQLILLGGTLFEFDAVSIHEVLKGEKKKQGSAMKLQRRPHDCFGELRDRICNLIRVLWKEKR